jgi:glycosyl transferase family 25
MAKPEHMTIASDVFVINLDRTPERMADFIETNPHLSDATRFPAVDGKFISRTKLVESGQFREPIFYSDGALGNMLSHREIWEIARKRDRYLTVFEDDAIVHQDFIAHANRVIGGLKPDWDIILWGWNFDESMCFDILPGVPCLAHFSQGDLRALSDKIQKMDLAPTLYKLRYAFGTVAYSVSPKGAEKLLSLSVPNEPFLCQVPLFQLEVENTGTDSVMTVLYNQLEAFTCVPPLVITQNMHAQSTCHEVGGDVIIRIRRKLGLSTGSYDERSGFSVQRWADYPGSRKFSRKYANYLYRKGDRLGTWRECLQYLFMRYHWYENWVRRRRFPRVRTSTSGWSRTEWDC